MAKEATKTVLDKVTTATGEFTVNFIKEKETKNAVRFQEEGTDGGDNRGKIGSLYVQKSAFKGTPPEKLTVTIEF